MKRITTELVKGVVIATMVISYFTITGSIKPKYEDLSYVELKNNGSSKLEINNLSLITCFGSPQDKAEFYLANHILEDLSEYVYYKKLEFEKPTDNCKLKIVSIEASEDICKKAIRLKVKVGDEWLNVNDVSTFNGYTFETFGDCSIWVWFELSKITKDEVMKSNGCNLKIEFGVE